MTFDGEKLLQAYRAGGRDGLLREELAQAYGATTRGTMAHWFAQQHMKLGEVDRALDHLERMVDERVGGVIFIGVDPCLSQMRGNPRYDALIARAGHPVPR